jgi:hypothetical protein
LFTQQVDETKTLKVPEEVSDLFIRQIKPDSVQLHTRTGLIFTHPISLLKRGLSISDPTRFIYINLYLERPKQDRPPLSFQGL